jgi:hypothetical protein
MTSGFHWMANVVGLGPADILFGVSRTQQASRYESHLDSHIAPPIVTIVSWRCDMHRQRRQSEDEEL